MAQLRDSVSSALLFEGSVEACVLLATEIGADEVLYDGVGLDFDPEAVLQARNERRNGWEAVMEGSEEELKAWASDALATDDEAVSEALSNLSSVQQTLQEAREQAEADSKTPQDPDELKSATFGTPAYELIEQPVRRKFVAGPDGPEEV